MKYILSQMLQKDSSKRITLNELKKQLKRNENDFINKVKTPVKKEEVKKTLEIIQILPKEKGGKITQKNHSNSISEADEEFLEAISKK